ncbi:MAG TPA: hypothetical protein VL553_08615 [Sphingomicrobium sp.]|nr:hypothetical protein [Sphingomicrobium sp.]
MSTDNEEDDRLPAPPDPASQEVRDVSAQVLTDIELGLQQMLSDGSEESEKTILELQEIVAAIRAELRGLL